MKRNGKTSQAEFRAIAAIVGILVFAISLPAICDRIWQQKSNTAMIESYTVLAPSQSDSMSYQKEGQRRYNEHGYSYNKPYTKYKFEKSHTTNRESEYQKQPVVCREFDPNSVTKEDLVSMGISSYFAGNLIKYRESGAAFRKPADIQKIYGMDSTLFAAIESCIKIETVTSFVNTHEYTTLDINKATVEEWQGLPGIGAVLAQRIVRYREHLGGFVSIQQIGETYGLPPETLTALLDKLSLSSGPRTIDINTASAEALAAHPYITQRQAETIVNFRTHHGKFVQLTDVMKIYSLQHEWLDKMQPYLTCASGTGVEDLVVR